MWSGARRLEAPAAADTGGGATRELAHVVGEDGFHCRAEGVVEVQNAVIEQVGGLDRHFGGIDLGER